MTMDDVEARAQAERIRAVSLIIAAIARIGTGTPPAARMAASMPKKPGSSTITRSPGSSSSRQAMSSACCDPAVIST